MAVAVAATSSLDVEKAALSRLAGPQENMGIFW